MDKLNWKCISAHADQLPAWVPVDQRNLAVEALCWSTALCSRVGNVQQNNHHNRAPIIKTGCVGHKPNTMKCNEVNAPVRRYSMSATSPSEEP